MCMYVPIFGKQHSEQATFIILRLVDVATSKLDNQFQQKKRHLIFAERRYHNAYLSR